MYTYRTQLCTQICVTLCLRNLYQSDEVALYLTNTTVSHSKQCISPQFSYVSSLYFCEVSYDFDTETALDCKM